MIRLVWVHVLLGIFLIVIPFVLNFSTTAMWVCVISGIVCAAVAGVVLATARRRLAI